jgi:hypothetical protein
VQGTVDCSAKEALTWWNMPLAREPTRASREHGNHARVLLTERSRHDFSWALVAKMPFFLLSREFLGRYICFSEASCLVLANSPLPEATKVDYGSNMRIVRGTSRTFVRFEPIGDAQCKVTLIARVDAGGIIPESVQRAKIPLALAGVGKLQEKFERNEEIDRANVHAVEEAIKEQLLQPDASTDLPADSGLVRSVVAKFEALQRADREELEQPDFHVLVKKYAVDSEDEVVGGFTTARDGSSNRSLRRPSLGSSLPRPLPVRASVASANNLSLMGEHERSEQEGEGCARAKRARRRRRGCCYPSLVSSLEEEGAAAIRLWARSKKKALLLSVFGRARAKRARRRGRCCYRLRASASEASKKKRALLLSIFGLARRRGRCCYPSLGSLEEEGATAVSAPPR